MNILTSSDRVFLTHTLDQNTDNYNKMMEIVATGSKLTKSSDDVVAYKKAEGYERKLSQYDIIEDNIRIGNEVLSTASNAQNLVIDSISRIRDLCLQMSNEIYTEIDKNNILQEIRSRLEYIDYVAASTNFNTQRLLDGSINNYLILFDTKQTMDIAPALQDVHTNALGITLNASVTAANWSIDDISDYIRKLDTASNNMINLQTRTGTLSLNLDRMLDLAQDAKENYAEAKSEVVDADYSKVASELVKKQILQQLSINVMVQYNQLAEKNFSILFSK